MADEIKQENELDKLRNQNAEFEKELLKAQTMRAEAQKIEAEKLLSGTAGAPIEIKPAPVETPKEYANKVMSGVIKAI
jgi:hypothetical protein